MQSPSVPELIFKLGSDGAVQIKRCLISIFVGPQKNAVPVCCLLALAKGLALLLNAAQATHIRLVNLLVYDSGEWGMGNVYLCMKARLA